MERRYNPRTETNSTVLIFHRGMGCVKGSVKNFSSHGMLVDTEDSTLPKGSVVELAGPASWRIKNKTGLPKGLIVHSKDGKVGLMLATESVEIVELSGDGTTISLKKRGIQKPS